MTQTNLTIAEVMKYPNAKIWHEGKVNSILRIDLSDNPDFYLLLTTHKYNLRYWENVADCKLILKDLCGISEKDATIVGRIMGVTGIDCPGEDLTYWADYTRSMYLGIVTTRFQNPPVFSAWEARDKLRELNYAIPGLPENVWVDEKSLTTKSE